MRRVTIGVCVRNCESTIRETIISIIAQDYPHELMEIIIVDGYSHDGTLNVIKETLRGSDIEHKIFFEKKGLGVARQIVVDNATGNYIVWVDGDMIIPKDFVRKQVEFIEKNPKAAIAKGRYSIIKQKSLVAFLENVEFALAFANKKEVKSSSVGASGCIYRVSAVKNIGGFDDRIVGAGEDSDIEFRLRAAGWKTYVSPAHFYERRRETWRELWKEYFWHGQGGFYVLRKSGKFGVQKMFPATMLFDKFIQIANAYILMHKKEVFFLPVHYIFKRISWLSGFLSAYIKSCHIRRIIVR